MALRRNAGKWGLRTFALGYLAMLLLIPVSMIFYRAFEHGLGTAWSAVTTPDALHAFYLTIVIAAIAVVANTIFGVACAAVVWTVKVKEALLLVFPPRSAVLAVKTTAGGVSSIWMVPSEAPGRSLP